MFDPMHNRPDSLPAATAAARACERVTAGVIAGVLPGRDPGTVVDWLEGQTPARRRGTVAAVIGGLFGGALLFASFGWIGLLAYGLIVAFLVA